MKKLLFFAAFLLSAAFVQAQTAEEVVAKHLAAIGASNWAGVETLKMEAKISSDAAAGMTILWSSTVQRNKAVRMDVSVMGMTQSMAVKGSEGWSTNPFMGQTDPEPMTADQAASMKDMMDIDGTLAGYKESGYTIEYIGTEDVDGVEAIKIKVNKDKKTEYSYFDPETYYEIKQTTVEEVDGSTVEQSTIFSNFTKTEKGVVLPYTIQQAGPMGPATITITQVTFNPTLDETIFDMPKK